MRVLLDTSVFLRLSIQPERVPLRLRRAVDSADQRFLSAASVWEIAVKASLGKLELPDPVGAYVPARMADMLVSPLAVTIEHAAAVERLPWLHRDPFDRLLIAQAKAEDLALLTIDPVLGRYWVSMMLASRPKRGAARGA